jgi:hypothetical protein
MNLKLEAILPFVLVAFLVSTFYFNTKPPEQFGNRKVIAPKIEAPQLIRNQGVVDGKISLKHIKSGDALSLEYYDNYLLLPPGSNDLPRGKDGEKIWELEYTKPTYWIDPRFEIGAYAGFLSGRKDPQNSTLDVGIKLSPARIFFDSTTIDALFSTKNGGVGISYYPAPIHFGPAWRNVGIGYGRMYSYNDGSPRNLFYFTISSHF